VHDELVAEVPRDEVDEVASILCEEMSRAYALDVPLVVDVRTGANWDEMTRMQVPTTA
jgi:DNA polymerase-1